MSEWSKTFPWSASVIRFFWPDGPARRKRWLKIATVVLVLVAAHATVTAITAAHTGRSARAFVDRWGPLDPSAHRPPKVDDAANKARAVRAAADLMVLPGNPIGSNGMGFQDLATGPEQRLEKADEDAARKLIADNALAFTILDAAAGRAASDWELHYERGLEVDVPPLLRLMQLSKLNTAAGLLALQDGRVDDALLAVRRGTTIASSLGSEPILIVQLVRSAVEKYNLRLVSRILGRADLDRSRIDALQAAVLGADPRRDIQLAMIVETKAFAAAFRGGADDSELAGPKRGIGNLIPYRLLRGPLGFIARPYLLREERLWLEVMASKIEAMNLPRRERPTEGAGPTLRRWDSFVRVVKMNLLNVVERADVAEIRRTLGETALAIERHRIQTGHAPATLADLVPAYLSAVPLDPWTGKPLLYEAAGNRWRLRSEADVSSVELHPRFDEVLDWSSH